MIIAVLKMLLKTLSSLLLGISLILSKSDAKTLYVIDFGYETSGVTLGQKIALLSCQVRPENYFYRVLKIEFPLS